MSDTVTSVEKHGTKAPADQAEVDKVLVRGGNERFEVQWDMEAKVTSLCATNGEETFRAKKIAPMSGGLDPLPLATLETTAAVCYM